jgi:hypothetical protein
MFSRSVRVTIVIGKVSSGTSVIGRWAAREGDNSYSHCQLGDWAAREGDNRYRQLRRGRG